MNLFKIKHPFLFTIFGASGDLAKVKLFPALYTLAQQNRLPADFMIYGYSRSKKSHEQFRNEFEESISKRIKDPSKKALEKIKEHLYYFSGQYDDPKHFKKFFDEVVSRSKGKKYFSVAHLSVPPSVYKPIIENLSPGKKVLGEDLSIIIEKPFGEDEQSATSLYHHVSRFFTDERVYLLDHYLGKVAVQSIITLRYYNRMLNILLSGNEIHNIQITAFEDTGIVNRAGYFDQVGIVKDMIQSHLLQILAHITMSLPVKQSAENLQREKYSVLSALNFIPKKGNIILGQYQSYHTEKDVPKNSRTETFAALRLFIDKLSWFKVPIYLRVGKKLKEKVTSIVIEFKKQKFQKFIDEKIEPNRLIIELFPEAKIKIKLVTTEGSVASRNYKDLTVEESLQFCGDECLPEHSNLLLDVFRGNRIHFVSFPEVIAQWKFIDKILKCIKSDGCSVHRYEDESMGPDEQHTVTKIDGNTWYKV